MSNTVSTQSLPTDEGSASGGSQRRLLMVVGGAALLLVLGLGAYFLFLSGGGEDEEAFAPIPRPTPTATDDAGGKKDKEGKKDDTVPADVEDDFSVGRDPFQPLAAEQVVEVEAPADEVPDPVDDVSGGADPDPAPVPAPAPTVNPTPTPTSTPTEDLVTYKVTLQSVDLAKDSAVIEVDGKRYLVKVKDMFTNSKTGPFKLTEVGERASGKATATVVFGSDAPVELVAKDTVSFTL